MQTLVAELLAAWRDGERVLDELSPVDADRETIALQVAHLKALYQQLTDRAEGAQMRNDAVRQTADRAIARIREARARLDPAVGAPQIGGAEIGGAEAG